MAKTIYWIWHTQTTEPEKNTDKYGEPSYKLMNNAIYGKTMENLRNIINEN